MPLCIHKSAQVYPVIYFLGTSHYAWLSGCVWFDPHSVSTCKWGYANVLLFRIMAILINVTLVHINCRVRRPIGRLTVREQKLEGEYRYVNSRLITNRSVGLLVPSYHLILCSVVVKSLIQRGIVESPVKF